MSAIFSFVLGFIIGMGVMLLLVIMWGLMSISNHISQESEQHSSDWRRGKE